MKLESYSLARAFEEKEKFANAGHCILVIDHMPGVWHQLIVYPGKSMIACTLQVSAPSQQPYLPSSVIEHDSFVLSEYDHV